MGIQNLEIQNQCLLSKWLFKLIIEDGLWQTILRNKYLSCQTIGSVDRKLGDSHFLDMSNERQINLFRAWIIPFKQ
jgi:hypothetical protein